VASPALLAAITGGGVDLPALALALAALVGSAALTLRSVKRRSSRKRRRARRGTPSAGSRRAIVFVAAAAIATAAVVVAWEGAKRSDARTSILQLWLLPDRAGGPGAVRVGVDRAGTAHGAYRLVVRTDSRPLRTWASLPLLVDHWRATVHTSAAGHVDAFLYRAGATGVPLRHVRLWLKAPARG
jgi:hypothetical protein